MTTLTFKQSSIGIYQLIEASDGRRYLMDTSSASSKTYGWGLLSRKVTVEMIELSSGVQALDQTKKSFNPTSIVVLAVQPLVKALYDGLKQYFQEFGVSQQLALKLSLFILSVAIAYALFQLYMGTCRQQAQKYLPLDGKKCRVVFRPTATRNIDYCLMVLVNVFLLGIYLFNTDGTEGVFLIINCILSTFWFIISQGMYPVGVFYNKGNFLLDYIEEV